MKGTNFKTNVLTSLVLVGLMGLGACAKQISKTDPNPIRTGNDNNNNNNNTETPKRECTDIITDATNSSIGGFFGKVVRNLEGPPTFCLTLDTSAGTSKAKATLRVEYEDDFGIRYYQANEDSTYFGSFTQDEKVTALDVVLVDDAGFIQIQAIEDSAGMMNGIIKYYNFPSYEDSLMQAAQEAAQKCKDGTYTVAYCMGFQSPANSAKWWEDPNYLLSPKEQLVKAAKAILSDNTKTRTLGKINFDLAEVLTQ